MHSITDKQLKHLYTLKQTHIQTKMNAYKYFHAFTCICVINTCVTDLDLKNKNAILHSYS